MAKKSKTQRAKASAARAQRKAQAREAEASAATGGAKEAAEAQKPKRTFFKKASTESDVYKRQAYAVVGLAVAFVVYARKDVRA